MKNLLKKLSLTLSFILGITILPSTPRVLAMENELTKIENKEALQLFKNFNKSIENKRSIKNIDTIPELTNEFKDLNFMSIENENDIDIVYKSENENLSTVIAYNSNSDTYILLEANNTTNDLILAINNEEYRLTLEGENIFAYSKNGEKIPVLLTEYQLDSTIPLLPQDFTKETRTTFGKNYGPFYRTNKVLVEVLGAAGTIGGVAALKVNHPVLGIISTIAGVISYVGDKAYSTLYIKYYQAYSVSDPTYVRQTDYYYNYNNYTSLVKSRIWHFYSSRPH